MGVDSSTMANPHAVTIESAAEAFATRVAALIIVLVSVCAGALYIFFFDDGDDMPPRADVSPFAAMKAMSSDEAPEFLRALARRYGPVFRLPLPVPSRFYVCADHETARAILLDADNHKPDLVYKDCDAFTAGVPSLFSHRDSATGSAWASARKAVAVAFTPRSVAAMSVVVERRVAELLAAMEVAAASGEAVDICAHMLTLTVGVICEAGFGYRPTQLEIASLCHDIELNIQNTLVAKARSAGRRLCPALYADCRAAAAASERSMAFAQRLLDRYRALDTAEAARLGGALVALLVANGSYADERARCADVLALLIAGHDTTAFQLGWALADLAAHREEQAELRAALARAAEPRECAELARALQESMRLHCVAAGGSLRVLARDLTLARELPLARCRGGVADGARRIPKGSVVQVHAHAMLRDAAVFAAPDTYAPARWAAIADWGAVAFPFALGRRNCVGQALARVEMAAVVSALVARFELEVATPPTPTYCLTYKPGGLRLRLRRVGAAAPRGN